MIPETNSTVRIHRLFNHPFRSIEQGWGHRKGCSSSQVKYPEVF